MSITRHARKIADAEGAEHTYTVTEFGAEEGFALALELWSLAGDVLSGMATSSRAALGAVLQRAAMQVQARGGAALMKRLLKDTTRDGRRFEANKMGEDESSFTFDVTYKANYGELLKAAAFVVEVNFASFFAGFSGKLGSLEAVMTAMEGVLTDQASSS